MLEKRPFLNEYHIDENELEKLGLKWDSLEAIYDDYLQRIPELSVTAETVTKRLGQIKAVHSLKSRLKDPAHLVEKIIRKRRQEPDRVIDVTNFRTEITDLIGVKALHLFKGDWATIHREICQCWNLADGQKPVAYIRKGDETKAFADEGCAFEEHGRGYRSVHYTVKSSPMKEPSIVEIQVRTIFEEGWSEIDHKIAYPYSVDDPMLSGYLAIFNVLAGTADQMASFINVLKGGLSEFRDQQAASGKELQAAIQKLEKLEKDLTAEKGEKIRLKEIVEALKKSSPPVAPLAPQWWVANPDLSNPALVVNPANPSTKFGYGFVTDPVTGAFVYSASRKCIRCGHDLGPQSTLAVAIRPCPKCGTLN